jgi:hypothetical protein
MNADGDFLQRLGHSNLFTEFKEAFCTSTGIDDGVQEALQARVIQIFAAVLNTQLVLSPKNRRGLERAATREKCVLLFFTPAAMIVNFSTAISLLTG